MRHFIFPRASFTRPVFAGAVSARSRRMPDPAAPARLVAPPRGVQRPPTPTRRAVGAVDVAPIAITADERLRAAIRRHAQEQPSLRQAIMLATAALAMPPPMAWTRAAVAAKMPLQSCLCTVCGTAPKQNWPVMDRRRVCLPIPAGSSARGATRKSERSGPPTQRWIAQVGPQGPPTPVASLRAKGAPRRGRVPPGDYLDNPRRRSQTPPSDRTSANSCGFWPAFTMNARSSEPSSHHRANTL
jgi:hypothetical protein